MALSSLRLRRASSLLKNIRSFSSLTSSSSSSFVLQSSSSIRNAPKYYRDYWKNQYLSFHSSIPSSSSRSYNNDDDKISPDTVLFEGCDYNHWLITMDFPKDPKPTPEEMVETYVQTLAKVVGSVEEAKKRMYACSTTTYKGFQAGMSEEMSEKFKGLPGVVFILPDSYIDPVNKEYGGDKYINGTIIPRPPPVQYGRQGRYGDPNRDRPPRNDRMPMQQGNQPYDRQGSMQGDGRNYEAPQSNLPQQNYGPGGQGERRDSIPVTGRDYTPGGRETFPVERRDPMPSYQRESNQGNQGNYPTQDQRDFTQGYQRNSAPTELRDRGVTPPPSGGFGQGNDFGYRQGYPGPGVAQGFQQNGMQERQGVSPLPSGTIPPPSGITPPPSSGYGQAAGPGYRQGYPVPGEAPRFQQTDMQERQGVSPPPSGITPPPSGGYGQAADSGYRQGYPVPGEAPRFQQTDMQERQGVSPPPSGITPPPSGGYGQAADSGYRQGYPVAGEAPRFQQTGMQERQGVTPAPSGGYGQGVDSGCRQGYPGPHVQKNGMQEGQGSYMPMGQDRNG